MTCFKAVFSCILVATSASAWAQNPETGATKFVQTTVQFSTSTYEYREPGLMKISGNMSGVLLGVEYRPQNAGLFFAVGAEYFTGTPTYDGALMSGRPISHDSDHYYYNLQAVAGRTYPLARMTNLQTSAGVARRYLQDKGQSRHAYEREQTYLYLPINVELHLKMPHNITLIPGVEYDYFLHGTNKSHLSDVAAGAPDLEFTQDSGSGAKLYIAMKLDTSVKWRFEIYHRMWAVDRSSSVTLTDGQGKSATFVEPYNETSQTGVSAGAIF